MTWLSLVGLGFSYAWKYAGTQGPAPKRIDWPVASHLVRAPHKPTLIHFVHPDCPCSGIGLRQLADALRKAPEGVETTVVLVGRTGLEGGMDDSANGRLARTIPHAKIVLDPNGEEARRFSARTSGQTFAFSPQGATLFRGGITIARGHYGPNKGLDALQALASGSHAPVQSAPVYGCALFEEGQ